MITRPELVPLGRIVDVNGTEPECIVKVENTGGVATFVEVQ